MKKASFFDDSKFYLINYEKKTLILSYISQRGEIMVNQMVNQMT